MTDFYRTQILSFLIGVAIYCAHHIKKRVGFLPALVFFIFSSMCLVYSNAPLIPAIFGRDLMLVNIYRSLASSSLIYLSAVVLILFANAKTLAKIFVYLVISNCLLTVAQIAFAWDINYGVGFFNTITMNTCFIICSSVLLIPKDPYLLYALLALSICSSSHLAVFMVIFIALYRQRSTLFITLFLAIATLFVWVSIHDLQNTERFRVWWATITLLFENRPWLGMAPGSFTIYGGVVTQGITGLWPWAHNDILQIFFEYGLILGTLFLYLLANIYWYARKNSDLLLAVCLYTIYLLGFYPLHFVPSAVLGGIILKGALENAGETC